MNFSKLKTIQQAVAAHGGSNIGSLLWWSLNGNHIERDRLEALAKQFGLDAHYLPAPVKPTTAFRRAWRYAANHCSGGLMLRQITEDENVIVLGLVQEQADATRLELGYTNLARVSFDKNQATVIADGLHPAVQEVTELYKHHLAHTTEDIRSMLTTFVRVAGVSLRDHGGTYFVPASYQGTLAALTAVVTTVGHNVVYELPIYDAPQVRGTLTEVARATLDAEIRAVQEELDGFDNGTRQTTMERRLAHFDELRGRVELFAGVLSFKADDLKSKLAGAQRDLRVKLGLEPASVSVAQDHVGQAEPGHTTMSWSHDEIAGF